MKFKVGDRVRKFTGDYTMIGEVVAAFERPAGWRYVVAHKADTGEILHIYSGANLQPFEPCNDCTCERKIS